MPNRHVLVVENDVPTLEFMVDMLTMHGYQVTPRETSVGVVKFAEIHQPDLVILDYRLGRPPNGFHLLQELWAQTTTAHIPVILYSAEGTFLDSHDDEVRRMGAEILHKPFDLDELVATIEILTSPART